MPQKYSPETAPSAEPDYVEQVRQEVVEHAAREDARSFLEELIETEGTDFVFMGAIDQQYLKQGYSKKLENAKALEVIMSPAEQLRYGKVFYEELSRLLAEKRGRKDQYVH